MEETFYCIFIKEGVMQVDKFCISDSDKEMESFHDFDEYKESIKLDMHKDYFFEKQCYQVVILSEYEFNSLHSS
jgi:hypothetical protein